MNRPLIWLALILACLLTAGGFYAWHKAIPYEEVVERGPSPEAQANPYLAAEHFLRQQGIAVEHANSLERLATLPSKGGSLLLLSERSNMTPRQVDQLLEWTQAGGHLLLVAEAIWDEETRTAATCCSIACSCARPSAMTSTSQPHLARARNRT